MQNEKYVIPIKERGFQLTEKVLDTLRHKIPAFQRYINRTADNKYGITFITHRGNGSIDDVFTEYSFNDIRRSDIVLDIGANVGAFSIFVSRFVKHVYSVEPMLYHTLKHNVNLNNIKNITIIDEALGSGTLNIPWEGFENRTMKAKSLPELISLCGKRIDFLKCDCEGGEHVITPSDLMNIRRIEAEVHNFDGKHPTHAFLKLLENAGFDYEFIEPRPGLLQVHGYRI